MGTGPCSRNGFWLCRFLHNGLCLPGNSQVQAHEPVATASSVLVFAAMVFGILLQTIAHLLSPPSLTLEVVAASIQAVAVVVFAVAMIQTIRQSNKRENYDRFLYAAIAWFLVAAIANPIVFKLFELACSRQQLLFNLATFNIPYRDVELLGFVVVMILGVSLRLLPHAYGFREPSQRWVTFVFWGVNGSIVVGATLFITGMASGNHWLIDDPVVDDKCPPRDSRGNAFSVSTVRCSAGERAGSRLEVYSSCICLVHRGDGNARVYSNLQLRHLHARDRVTSSVLSRLLWGVSSLAYRRVHHDDDRWCVEQSRAHAVGCGFTSCSFTVAYLSGTEHREPDPSFLPDRHRLLTDGLSSDGFLRFY